jgi:hypothetical protein
MINNSNDNKTNNHLPLQTHEIHITVYPSGAPEFTPGCECGSCYSIFSFICIFWRSLFVLLSFFSWSLCCLFFFDIRIMITPLVSSNSSYNYNMHTNGLIRSQNPPALDNWIFNSSPVDMSLHYDTLVWFRGNQSLILLLKVTCLTEKATLVKGLEPKIYSIRGEYANHYITIWVLTLLIK